MKILKPLVISTFLIAMALPAQAASGRCDFNKSKLQFAGNATTQAKCLLSPIKRYAHLGKKLEQLPNTLAKIIGQPIKLDMNKFKKYLTAENLTEKNIGGNLSKKLSQTAAGIPALYFVVHDTSTPNLEEKPFPADLDGDDFVNNLPRYDRGIETKAHIYVNRGGETFLGFDFIVAWRATKLELDIIDVPSRGRFIHIELVQPRRRDPNGGSENDAIAPVPGFSNVQYKRLAELYIAASLRSGKWMIPAYHTVIDHNISGGHDDPQNFNLEQWDKTLSTIIKKIQAL